MDSTWFLLRFILGAPLLILGTIMLIMFNAATIAWAVSRLLSGLGFLTPVLRTAIAYPLSSRFRTGMTMILFAMIITTVTLMTVVIEATQTLVTPDSERYAGFEIGVYNGLLSFFDPLEDLEAELPTKSDFPSEEVAVVGSVASLQANAQQLAPAPSAGADDPTAQPAGVDLVGLNSGYLFQAQQVYGFSRRAAGYASDRDIWEALRTRDDVVIVTADLLTFDTGESLPSPTSTTVPGNAEEDAMEAAMEDFINEIAVADFSINLPVDETDETTLLPEIILSLQSGEQPGQTVHVIGVIAQDETLAGAGVWLSRDALTRIAGEAVNPNAFYIKVAAGADVHSVAQAAERSFLNNAVNATVLAESFAQGQALTRGILQLLQGFMGLGLLVGIAALGVISTRTVVERRQQVGMLRAIGFQPYMVALTFLLESSFIALTGIGVGASVGTLLGEALVGSSYETLADGRLFSLPWAAIGLIVLIAYGSSLLTTILPALQASRIYPAEALRYE
jgi:putative ABC transport system permease protein